MANFRINATTRDTEGNESTESVEVRSGEAFAPLPTVSFQFPQVISTSIGNSSNPLWSNSVSRGFAFIGVTPSPSDVGTGAFWVQTYYNSGTYPHAPSRTFKDTVKGDGTVLSQDWFFSSASILVEDGGGLAGSGFFQQTDVSGLRPALVISQNQEDDSPVFGFDDGRGRPGYHGRYRIGGRVPEEDSIIVGYHHDLTSDPEALKTIQVVQEGGIVVEDDEIDDTEDETPTSDPRGGRRTTRRVIRTRSGWPAGSFIYPHPYHYCPVYENNNLNSIEVEPVVLAVEDGPQYSLRGTVSVNGTQVEGLYTRFDTQISGQSVIRFEGTDQWYIVSGVLSSSGLVIYDYGENPQLTDVAAEANRYAVGSGLIEVLPNLAGCSAWNVTLTPRFNDGEIIPGDSVVYTAEYTGGGAISGTPMYEWTKTEYPVSERGQLGGPTTITTSGIGPTTENTFEVPYDETKVVTVSLRVSGTGQPACVHTFSTGEQVLIPGANAGTWAAQIGTRLNSDGETVTSVTYTRLEGAGAPTDRFYHQRGSCWPAYAKAVDNGFALDNSTILMKVDESDMDLWPSDGGMFVAYARKASNSANYDESNPAHKWGVNLIGKYTGKTSSTLTGVSFWYKITHGSNGVTNCGFINGNSTQYRSNSGWSTTFRYYGPGHWPFTYITGIDDTRTVLQVEEVRSIVGARSTGQKLWVVGQRSKRDDLSLIAQAGMSIRALNLAGYSPSNNTIELDAPLPSEYKAGDTIMPALWDHPINGSPERIETVHQKFWNVSDMFLNFFIGASNVTGEVNPWDVSPYTELTGGTLLTFHGTKEYTIDPDENFSMAIAVPMSSTIDNMSLWNGNDDEAITKYTLKKIHENYFSGRWIILDQNRNARVVVRVNEDPLQSFSTYTITPINTGRVYYDCRIDQDLTGEDAYNDDGTITLRQGQVMIPYRPLNINIGALLIRTIAEYDDPNLEIYYNVNNNASLGLLSRGVNFDLVQAFISGTVDVPTGAFGFTYGPYAQIGLQGSPRSEPLWEDASLINGFPDDAIVAPDPIFRAVPDALPEPEPDDPCEGLFGWKLWLCMLSHDRRPFF